MMTQKQMLANLRDYAADLGALVSIRKNIYGEYDTRIRMNGARVYVMSYLADSFEDAVGTARFELNRIENDQRAEEHRKHPSGDYCVFCRSQWPCAESDGE